MLEYLYDNPFFFSMNIIPIIILSIIQGLAELLPVSSSAHVIIAEHLMGLDPSTPEMAFLLVMLHTGTMFAVILFFWKRWKALFFAGSGFLQQALIATFCTGVVGLGLKTVIEKVILERLLGYPEGEIEHLFRNLPLIALALTLVGTLIVVAGKKSISSGAPHPLQTKISMVIGIVQGICLPFRGFSRSGATISTGLLCGLPKPLSENFSFVLVVLLTPAVIVHEGHRLVRSSPDFHQLLPALLPALLGMVFSFFAGLVALRWLSSWLEKGRWQYFGYYCWVAALGVLAVYQFSGFVA